MRKLFLLLIFVFFLSSCGSLIFTEEKNSTQNSAVNSRKNNVSKEELILIKTPEDLGKIDRAKASVEKFGAAGDGVTDDTEAVIRAMGECETPVFFPEGKYLITKTLDIPYSNSGIFGEKDKDGKSLVTICVDEDIDVLKAEKRGNIVLDSFFIKKKWINNSPKEGILIRTCTDVYINNVEISGFSARRGIAIEYSESFNITNNFVHDFSASAADTIKGGGLVDSYAIAVANSKKGNIQGNRINNIEIKEPLLSKRFYQSDGININGCEGILIEKNNISNVGEGIDVIGSKNITVNENYFENTFHCGIKLIHGTRDCTFTGNTIKNATMSGFDISAGSISSMEGGKTVNNTIKNNTIINVGAINPWQDRTWYCAGILLSGNPEKDGEKYNECTQNIIENNTITDDQPIPTTRFGIFEREVAKGNIIKDNNISPAVGVDIIINEE